jgi:hypothetical protein
MTPPFKIFDPNIGDRLLPYFFSSGAPVNGASGTFAGVAAKGTILITDEPATYQNAGTLASPNWTIFASNEGNVAITGGTIDGAVIGGTTPAAATFSSITTSALNTPSVAAGLTASVTQTQVGALALTKQTNQISTCAHSGDAVRLAALTPGQYQDVYNDGANPMSVFPATSGNIDGAGANAAVTLTNAKRCRFTCMAANVIESAQFGVAAA